MRLKPYTYRCKTLGVQRCEELIVFSVQAPDAVECSLKLYPRDGSKEISFPMNRDINDSGIFSAAMEELNIDKFDYNFVIDGEVIVDPYARRIVGREAWGDRARFTIPENIKGRFHFSDYSWNNDVLPLVPKEDMMMYKLHARGFTKALKGKKYAGFLDGVVRKIPYFKELGVTTIEFMPLYEFEEMMDVGSNTGVSEEHIKLNYWGYCKGDYFAPKAAYLGKGQDPDELKKIIHKLHQNKIECIFEMYFPQELNPIFILECLRFWSSEYHVDGFHLICDYQVAQLVAQDFMLYGRKLFFESFHETIIAEPKRRGPHIYTYNEEFAYAIRKMLNQQAGNLYEFTGQMRRQDERQGFVNFVANYNGFTLNDLFTYERKHNEGNLDQNMDGNDFNFSSNCGYEGESRKKNIINLRKRQIRNALTLVFLAQGIPLLWMGDESGNSQQGNNNAYCQDNEIGWKSWESKLKNRQLLQYVKELRRFRQRYPMLHKSEPMKMYDETGLGYPDLSYHINTAWMTDFASNQPYIGMLYCNKSELADDDNLLEFVYIAYNFQFVPQEFALPVLQKGFSWHTAIDTKREEAMITGELPLIERAQTFFVQPQSITVLISMAD